MNDKGNDEGSENTGSCNWSGMAHVRGTIKYPGRRKGVALPSL